MPLSRKVKLKKKKIDLIFFSWSFHVVFREQKVVSHQILKSGAVILFKENFPALKELSYILIAST